MNYLYASIRRDAPLCKEVQRRTYLTNLNKWQAHLVAEARAAQNTEVKMTFTVSIPRKSKVQAGIQDWPDDGEPRPDVMEETP